MRKVLFAIVFILLMLLVVRIYSYFKLMNDDFKIFIAYNPSLLRKCSYVLSAYESVLQEEGVPYEKIDYSLLNSMNKDDAFIQRHPAIVLPDCALQQMNPEVSGWFEEYLSKGGSLLLVYDVGIKDYKGAYLEKPLFTSILGINYCPYEKMKDKTYTLGHLKVNDPALLGITPGKWGKEHGLIRGYAYGPLEYPTANVQVLNPSFFSLAEIVLKEKNTIPGIVLKEYGEGKIFYVNMPLGYLKAYSDDLLLRSVIRTFLFKILKIPHLVNTPYGIGGMVINWHIDANPDWKSIPYMMENGYLVKGLEFSNHITAGDFRDNPGDKLGFDACGKGKEYVKMIWPYGEIGSHGGWAHN